MSENEEYENAINKSRKPAQTDRNGMRQKYDEELLSDSDEEISAPSRRQRSRSRSQRRAEDLSDFSDEEYGKLAARTKKGVIRGACNRTEENDSDLEKVRPSSKSKKHKDLDFNNPKQQIFQEEYNRV